jgi:four helix bundle protein
MSVDQLARSYRDLKAWQLAMRLAQQCDELVDAFPKRGPAGLISQLERAAGSVAANIAEGSGRRSRPDYLRHLAIANGSLLEVETHVLRAAQVGLVKPSDVTRVLATSAETGRVLAGLIRWVERAHGA